MRRVGPDKLVSTFETMTRSYLDLETAQIISKSVG